MGKEILAYGRFAVGSIDWLGYDSCVKALYKANEITLSILSRCHQLSASDIFRRLLCLPAAFDD